MHKTPNDLYVSVVSRGLTMSKYKGDHQAKRMMMRAGLPVDVINKVLMQEKDVIKELKSDQT